MTKTRKTKREAPISYRPPAHLWDEFHARVEKSGLSYNAFLNKCVFDTPPPRQSRRPSLEMRFLAWLLGKAGKACTYMREIVKGSTDDFVSSLAQNAVDELTELRSAIMKKMMRKP